MQINARLFPLSLDSTLGEAFHIGDLTKGKPTEKFQIDNLRQRAIDTRQLVESVAHPREFLIVAGYVSNVSGQRSNLERPAPLDCQSISHMIDDESPHDPCGISHEPAAIGEGLTLLPSHIKVSLVNKRRGTDAYLTLTRKLALRKAMEFRVQQSKKSAGGNFITLLCQVNERRNARVGRLHGIQNTAHSLSHFCAIVKTKHSGRCAVRETITGPDVM